MAFRSPVVKDTLAGETVIVYNEPWDDLQEQVYYNGRKLVRGDANNIYDYQTGRSNENLAVGQVDQITLTEAVVDDADVIELYVYVDQGGSTIESKIDDIMTATIGSWVWDKSTGLMTMYDLNGSEKFKFSVEDTAEEASRERRADLEL